MTFCFRGIQTAGGRVMSFGQEPEDDYECVDHGDPNIAPINIKSAGTLAWQHVVGVVVVVAVVVLLWLLLLQL